MASHLSKEFTVVALDLPGHGQSDDPDHELTCEDFAEAALAVLDDHQLSQLGHLEPAFLLGQHGGGSICLQIATAYPSRARSLILSGTGIRSPTAFEQFRQTPLTRDIPMDHDGEFLKKTYETYRKLSAPGVKPELVCKPMVQSLLSRLRPYDAHWALMRWDKSAAFSKLTIPLKLIQGEHDAFCQNQEELANRLACDRQVLPGGAFLLTEAPEACATSIAEFFSRSLAEK